MSLKKSIKPKFGKYEKFISKHNKIVVIDNGFFIARQYALSLKSLGEKVVLFPIRYQQNIFPAYYKRFTNMLKSFKPDLVFTINFAGFDEEQRLYSLLNLLELRTINYLITYPLLTFKKYNFQDHSNFIYFVPDFSWINLLENIFGLKSYYLPFALNPKLQDLAFTSSPKSFQITYSGKTNLDKIDDLKYCNPINENIDVTLLVENLLKRYLNAENSEIKDIIHVLKEYEKETEIQIHFKETEERYAFYIRMLYLADIYFRKRVIEHLEKQKYFRLFGDERWLNILNKKTKLFKIGSYHEDLLKLYSESILGLNLTSYMLPYSMNQKFLEMPIFNCLPISNARAEYLKQFSAMDKDFSVLPVFNKNSQLIEIIEYYLEHEEIREELLQFLKNHILKNHTYLNRASKISSHINKNLR